MDMADRMAEDGYREAGYQYISIDVSVTIVVLIKLCNSMYKQFDKHVA